MNRGTDAPGGWQVWPAGMKTRQERCVAQRYDFSGPSHAPKGLFISRRRACMSRRVPAFRRLPLDAAGA
ncbi:hypothetical protein A8H39_33475 [Paraburkholderia fungorum]|nr:hypothetical protein A8H39_33475 [Paraburkholderia fungorum]